MERKLKRSFVIVIAVILVMGTFAMVAMAKGSKVCPRCSESRIKGSAVNIGDFDCHRVTCFSCDTTYLQPHKDSSTGICPDCNMWWHG